MRFIEDQLKQTNGENLLKEKVTLVQISNTLRMTKVLRLRRETSTTPKMVAIHAILKKMKSKEKSM
jgi:hypothetical protein